MSKTTLKLHTALNKNNVQLGLQRITCSDKYLSVPVVAELVDASVQVRVLQGVGVRVPLLGTRN